MAVTLEVSFPLGRYHATPWDRNVNEGACEWPPSPWRILRALVATWYTRWPDLPAADLDGLLDRLGSPPAYHTPPATAGHSRHYLPDADHRKGETGATDLALDPFLSVPADQPLLIRWDTDLTTTQRSILAKLAELLPYLGRAESVCQARLLDPADEETVDTSWWVPAADPDTTGMRGAPANSVRLLASAQPVRRAALDATTVAMRKARRTRPEHSIWVTYQAPAPAVTVAASADRVDTAITAVRYTIQSAAPMRASHGVLLADALHTAVGHRLKRRVGDDAVGAIFGKNGRNLALTDHQHAHWIPLGDDSGNLRSIIAWIPAGLPSTALAEMIKPVTLTGRRGDYEVKGFPPVTLILAAMGEMDTVAPELTGTHRVWRSATPYLPVRHRKRHDTANGFLSADIQRELAYRKISTDVVVTRREPGGGIIDSWGRGFRRYRLKEHLGQARPGLGLRLEFAGPVRGPLLLGQLSHFGLGAFVPER